MYCACSNVCVQKRNCVLSSIYAFHTNFSRVSTHEKYYFFLELLLTWITPNSRETLHKYAHKYIECNYYWLFVIQVCSDHVIRGIEIMSMTMKYKCKTSNISKNEKNSIISLNCLNLPPIMYIHYALHFLRKLLMYAEQVHDSCLSWVILIIFLIFRYFRVRLLLLQNYL